MRIQDMRDATSNFNIHYQCYWEHNNKILPISDLQYDKKSNTLFLLPQNSKPIHFRELNILIHTLEQHTKICIKTKSGKSIPLFGFRITDSSKILLS